MKMSIIRLIFFFLILTNDKNINSNYKYRKKYVFGDRDYYFIFQLQFKIPSRN